MRIKLLILFLLCAVNVAASTEGINNIISQINISNTKNIDLDNLYDDLIQLKQDSININEASRTELEEYFFLSQFQIENLLEYIFDYGELLTCYELELIEGFDETTIKLLLEFVYIAPKQAKQKFSLKNIFKYGKHQIINRFDYDLQLNAGYLNRKYLGNPWGGYLKYRFTHKNLSFGLTCEKDAYEPFDWVYNKGFDFYSAYISLNNLWYFKQILIGDFRANFGQGLVFNSSASFGKNSPIFDIAKRKDSFSKYSSCTEYGFFRGLSTTIEIKDFQLNAFVSYNKGEEIGGYHRTLSEIHKKQVEYSCITGLNFNYKTNKLKLGISGLYDFKNSIFNISADYRFLIHKFLFAGELAIDKAANIATMHTISFQAHENISLSALFRYYGKNYYAPYANAFSEGDINNELGIAMKLECTAVPKLNISAFIDIYKFYLPKYLVDKPSNGYDAACNLIYSIKYKSNISFNYKLESKEKNYLNSNKNIPPIYRYIKHDFNLFYYSTNDIYTIKSGVLFNIYTHQVDPLSTGILLFQDFGYNINKIGLKFNARIAFFDIPKYENRIYAYENDIYQAFSIPSFQGQGFRTYLNINFNYLKFLSIYTRIGLTYYTDRKTIGSGNELINDNKKADIRIVLNWKF